MSIVNDGCIARPFSADGATSSDRELWLVSVPAVDYVREAFFGALSLLGDPQSYNPVSDQAADYGSEIIESLTQIYPPTGAAVTVTEVNIDSSTVFPLLLKTASAGEVVDEVLIDVTTAWDAGDLTIGDAGDVDRLMPAAFNDPSVIGQFQVSPEHVYTVETDILIYLTGSPTTGTARIVLYSYTEA